MAAAGGGGGAFAEGEGAAAAVNVNVERGPMLRLRKRGSANIQRNTGELLSAVAARVARMPGARFKAHIADEDGELQLTGDPRVLAVALEVAKSMNWQQPKLKFLNTVHVEHYVRMPRKANLPAPGKPAANASIEEWMNYESKMEEYRQKFEEAEAAAEPLSAVLPSRVNWNAAKMRPHSNKTRRNRNAPGPNGRITWLMSRYGTIPPALLGKILRNTRRAETNNLLATVEREGGKMTEEIRKASAKRIVNAQLAAIHAAQNRYILEGPEALNLSAQSAAAARARAAELAAEE